MYVSHALGSSVSLFPQAHAADRLKLPHQATWEVHYGSPRSAWSHGGYASWCAGCQSICAAGYAAAYVWSAFGV